MTVYSFGKKSTEKLLTCHIDLQELAQHAIARSPYDLTIVHGWRGEDVQNALQESGASHKRYPNSKHNNCTEDGVPLSLALDFAPWIDGAIPWNDTHIFAVIVGVFFACADELDINLRTGLDWDGDGLSKGDQTLMDYGHLELI